MERDDRNEWRLQGGRKTRLAESTGLKTMSGKMKQKNGKHKGEGGKSLRERKGVNNVEKRWTVQQMCQVVYVFVCVHKKAMRSLSASQQMVSNLQRVTPLFRAQRELRTPKWCSHSHQPPMDLPSKKNNTHKHTQDACDALTCKNTDFCTHQWTV